MLHFKYERLTHVTVPSKAHNTDAGLDFFMPSDLAYIIQNGIGIKIGMYTRKLEPTGDIISSTAIEIGPHESVLIPMGIKTQFDDGWGLLFLNRSGIASKKHLYRGPCLVDSSYRGELKVGLTNLSNNKQYLLPGDKLIQAVFIQIPDLFIEEGIVDIDTERGEGGFGSTDKK